MAGTFLASLDVTVVGVAMPTIAAKLGRLDLYGWVFSIYLFLSTVTVPLYGRLADGWGTRRTYLAGLAVFVVGSLACGLAPSMPALVAARAIQGVGAGALVPVTLIAIGRMYEVTVRARIMSAFSLVWGVSSVAGPAIGGVLLKLGWPWIFLVNVPIGAVVALALWLAWAEPAPEARASLRGTLRLGATAALTLATGAGLAALKTVSTGAWGLSALLFASCLAFTALFKRLDAADRDEGAIFPAEVVRDRPIRIAASSGVFLGGALFVPVAFVPLFMRVVLGESARNAGFALIPMSLLWTGGAFFSARWIHRAGYRAPVIAGSAAVALSGAMLLAGVALTSGALVVLGGAMLGIGMGLSVTATNVLAQERVGASRKGAATALLQFVRTMGGTVFVSALGLVLSTVVTRAVGPAAASRLGDDVGASGELDVAMRVAVTRGLTWVFGGRPCARPLCSGSRCASLVWIARAKTSILRRTNLEEEL
ncbi:MAG: MFS transporter [Polyangiaceae bacterium]